MKSIAVGKIKKLQELGFNMTPVLLNKKPELVRGKWFHGWTLKELAKKERIGVWHKQSGFYDCDFDDEKKNCHKFMPLFPETFTSGKTIDGVSEKTHLIYNSGTETPIYESYPKVCRKDEKKIELLTNHQTWILGDDRVVINDIPPSKISPHIISDYVKMTYAFGELLEHWPEANKGMRDGAHMRLAGALARETNVPTEIKEKFVERLCEITGDREVRNRVNKIRYQEKQFKENPEKVYGIGALSEYLDVNLPAFDVLKNNVEKDKIDYPLIDGRKLTAIEYPPVRFVLRPIFTERSMNQIYGSYGGGKTIFGLSCSMAMCSGQDFAGFKSELKVPTGYLESELPGDDFKDRRNSILQGYTDNNIPFNFDGHFTLTMDDLRMAGFKYGFDPIAVSSNLNNPDAKDYGRRGREHISTWVRNIEKKTGKKPFFFLDNITMLTEFDENRAQDWSPLTKWLIHEKNNGFANCFIHHPNKSTLKGGSSGSNAKERLLDTSIALEKLDHKHRFALGGNKNVQCKVSFDKGRNFAGSDWDKEFMLTMTEEGKWTKYPMLDKYDFLIIEGHNRGLSVDDMKEEFDDLKIAVKTIYKRLKKLKDMGVIKDETNR